MNRTPLPASLLAASARYSAGFAVWAAGWLVLVLLDGTLDLSGLGMLLVLIAVLASIWLPLPVMLVFGILAVMAFNWMFVPPRGSFAIDLQQHATLMLVMFVLSAIVTGLMSMLRAQVRHAQQQALAADTLRAWSEQLRDADNVHDCLADLARMLRTLGNAPTALLALRAGLPRDDDESAVMVLGDADAEQRAGLWYCLRNGQALGPTSGRYQQQLADIYLPLRGRDMPYGAARVGVALGRDSDAAAHAQDLCDRMGAALERQHLRREQAASRQAAREQELRATLLTAIAHDYRTPLATIMSAASLLERQDQRIGATQRFELARRIVGEAARLKQMTGNILQLARLDAPGLQLRYDWESAEELLGAVLQRFRTVAGAQRLVSAIEPGLPLLWCDPLLVSQVLDNLVDNALKHGIEGGQVCLGARLEGEALVLFVRDLGPGIAENLREAIFQPFTQGRVLPALAAAPQGVGIGLALCRVIAQAHGAELRLESAPTGSCFSLVLPLRKQPPQPDAASEPEA